VAALRAGEVQTGGIPRLRIGFSSLSGFHECSSSLKVDLGGTSRSLRRAWRSIEKTTPFPKASGACHPR
jgi:hypothetical protein